MFLFIYFHAVSHKSLITRKQKMHSPEEVMYRRYMVYIYVAHTTLSNCLQSPKNSWRLRSRAEKERCNSPVIIAAPRWRHPALRASPVLLELERAVSPHAPPARHALCSALLFSARWSVRSAARHAGDHRRALNSTRHERETETERDARTLARAWIIAGCE